jgi:hypothetical protein
MIPKKFLNTIHNAKINNTTSNMSNISTEKDTVAVLLPKCPGNDVCRPFVQCSALLSPQEALSKLCTLEGGSKGVCCKEVTRLEGTNSIIVVEDLGLRSISNLGVLSNSLVLRALDVGNSFLQNVTNSRSKATTNSNSASAVFQHAAFQQPMPGININNIKYFLRLVVGIACKGTYITVVIMDIFYVITTLVVVAFIVYEKLAKSKHFVKQDV